jgi:hypothetical protein
MSEYDKPISSPEKRYLGDGAYVEFDGYYILLTTEDGISTTNTVALDPDVWLAFKRWGKELDEYIREALRRQNQKRQEGTEEPN